MNTAFQYKFSNAKRLPCPRCGSSRGLAPIKGYEDSPEYGFCHACGETAFPNSKPFVVSNTHDKVIEMASYVKAIDPVVVERSLKGYAANPFAQFLSDLFGKPAAEEALFYWRIGTSKGGGTVFWFIDSEGRPRQPKIIYYAIDGKRLRHIQPTVPEGYTSKDGYTPCLFGEFQLTGMPDVNVMLVESEKTAVLGKLIKPDNAWIATSGSHGLTQQKAFAIRGRNVLIICDNDKGGREGTRRTAETLKNLNCQVGVFDRFKGKAEGYDLADYIVETIKSGVSAPDMYDDDSLYQTTNPYQDNYIPF